LQRQPIPGRKSLRCAETGVEHPKPWYNKYREVQSLPNKQWHPAFVAAVREALKDVPAGQVEGDPGDGSVV
jgi:hypothetical protein